MAAGFTDLNRKGQLSIEFILILTVVILLLQVVVLPMRDSAESALDSFTKISYLDKSAKDIQSVVDKLSNISEGRLSVDFYVPEDANFYVYSGKVHFDVLLDYNAPNGIRGCNGKICQKDYNFSAQADVTSFQSDAAFPHGSYTIAVKKNDAGIIFERPVKVN